MPNQLKLDRQVLARFLPNHQSIIAFEQMQEGVSEGLPSTIEEANALAGQSMTMALQALAILADLVGMMDTLTGAPASQPSPDADDSAPRAQLGTISAQNHDAVEITGGRVGLDAGTVAAPSFYLAGEDTTGLYRVGANSWGLSIAGVNLVTWSGAAAAFTQNVSTTKQLISTVAIGTPPLIITSTTQVPNLYVARAALADTATVLASPSSFPAAATDLTTVITLANALRTAAIAKGL